VGGGGPPGTSFSGASISSTLTVTEIIVLQLSPLIPLNTFVEPQHCELSIFLVYIKQK
jgi:hypothetical protein